MKSSILTPYILTRLAANGLEWDESNVWSLVITHREYGSTLARFSGDHSPGAICREVERWIDGYEMGKLIITNSITLDTD